jgi:CrcB protein
MGPVAKSLWIAGGAAIGANLRFWLGELVGQRGAMVFPWATFAINVLGSLAIGIFYAWEMKYTPHFQARLFIAVGICGGFTTFSTFSWESLRLMEKGEWFAFGVYAVGSVVLTIAACALGYFVTRGALQG